MRSASWLWYLGICFVVGAGLGYRERTDLHQKVTGESPDQLVLLIPEGSLPEDLIESFQAETEQSVLIHTYRNYSELIGMIRDSKTDIALVSHEFVPQLKTKQLLSPIDPKELKNVRNISADFRDLPADPGGRFSIPLFWGVRKGSNERAQLGAALMSALQDHPSTVQAQNLTGLPIEASDFFARLPAEAQRPSLWVEMFVIPSSSTKTELAHEFIDFFLDSSVAQEFSRLTLNSSTNKSLENSHLDETLKPSHLRKQSLADITRPSPF